MHKHKQSRHTQCYHNRGAATIPLLLSPLTLLSLLIVFIYTEPADAGASSTPKNLVNLDHASSELSNLSVAAVATAAAANSNQFQNEYQYRQSATKPALASADRHKLSTSEPLSSPTSLEHQLLGDASNLNHQDFPYSDNRLMTNVPDCHGRLKLNATRGFITDGLRHYPVNTQCTWLIDSGLDNARIRIRIHQFNTECNYDYLYIFDGDSIYSPLVAALSGDMKDFSNSLAGIQSDNLISENHSDRSTAVTTLPGSHNMTDLTNVELMHTRPASSTPETAPLELETRSGKAFIYFHSDTAQTMPGFYLTYSVNSCPLDCSSRGDCIMMECRCSPGYFGPGCQYASCPNNCTSPVQGSCDGQRSCVCNKGFYGPDCSQDSDLHTWSKLNSAIESDIVVPGRAFHQSVIVGNTMWVFGGKSQALSNTNMGIYRNEQTTTILAFDLVARRWMENISNGTTNQDHLAELSGHSAVAHGNKVFIFGGMSMNNSILNTLSVFDTKDKSLIEISNKKDSLNHEELVAPVSVTGHSANIIDGFMYIFMGYNPLYGYLNFAQKFSFANNSWSIVERKGSSVSGCIGHTSTFDPMTQLVYIYGGHTVLLKSNKLYSFNPQTEIWTYLQAGPSPRYHHSALIMNGLLVILGGNSYNTSHRSDQCFQQTHLSYDLGCSQRVQEKSKIACLSKCWSTLEDTSPGVFKRHGHTMVNYNDQELLLFGGFNAIIMNDLRSMKISHCSSYVSETECDRPKLGAKCFWNRFNNSCELVDRSSPTTTGTTSDSGTECSKNDVRSQQSACEARETCSDCLHTNLGCVWCDLSCHYDKCRSITSKPETSPHQCFRMDPIVENILLNGTSNDLVRSGHFAMRRMLDNQIDCKLDNCYLCQSKPHCSWQNDACIYTPLNALPSPAAPSSMIPSDELTDVASETLASRIMSANSSSFPLLAHTFDPYSSRPFLTSLSSRPSSSTCDVPCYERHSCQSCATSRCIWLSFTEQCIESSAYFAYQATGQCAMHYVAHLFKCPAASCSEIESCDRCLTNPKCGWLNDMGSNSGKGKCLEGNNSGPSLGTSISESLILTEMTSATTKAVSTTLGGGEYPLSSWFYTSCPACQCNGHSTCKRNPSVCTQPCQDFTEGEHCERCIHGYYGDPINGGTCRPCRCNGHATSCSRDTGKCHCSTKGIVGHNCNRCDDKNYYIGDPSSPGNGTCYYNLTTDYQYTFNMSKPEDHFYDEINFINLPLRKDSDIDFSIACSRLALMNISSGTSFKTRRPIHTGLECGSFRLRFMHDRLPFSDANYSFFVQVYRFQTPFILQIAFSQHRTLYLPQFFFTVSSLFLFFFAVTLVLWKLKHEYELYVRRQRQFIEREQMASRPFSTILLELFRPSSAVKSVNSKTTTSQTKPQRPQQGEPTPISFEPCFSNNVGVVSFVVQLPGKPSLAIGSSLVELSNSTSMALMNDDALQDNDDQDRERRSKITSEKFIE